MEKLISLKERLKNISLIIEALDNTQISLIERDILMQNIRDLYIGVAELDAVKDSIIKPYQTSDDKAMNLIDDSKSYITRVENRFIESAAENIIMPVDEIKEPENEIKTITNEPVKPSEDNSFSIDFLDEPAFIDNIDVNQSEPSENASIFPDNLKPEEIKKPEQTIVTPGKTVVEQASLFSSPNPKPEVKTLGEQLVTNRTSLNEVLARKKQQQDISSFMNQKPVADIKSAIGLGDRFLYIRELFNGSSERFEDTIAHLNSLSNFQDAQSYLFENFQWSDTQDTVISFVNIVKRKYL